MRQRRQPPGGTRQPSGLGRPLPPMTTWPLSPRNQKRCQGWKIVAPVVRRRRDERLGRARSARSARAPRAVIAPAIDEREDAVAGQREQDGADREHGPGLRGDRQAEQDGGEDRAAVEPRRARRRSRTPRTSSSSGWPISSARSVTGLATQRPRTSARAAVVRPRAPIRRTSATTEQRDGDEAGDRDRAVDGELAAAERRRRARERRRAARASRRRPGTCARKPWTSPATQRAEGARRPRCRSRSRRSPAARASS